MSNVCLVSCVSAKQSKPAPAEDMYVSPLFRGAKHYAQSRFDKWFILSAEYGLIKPRQRIAPYEKTLKTARQSERKAWADNVFEDLMHWIAPDDVVTLVAGMDYREFLLPALERAGIKVNVPLEGMSIGLQLQWLGKFANEGRRLRDLDRFYELLAELRDGVGGMRKMRDCTGEFAWPQMGVYFFFELGEMRTTRPTVARVTRVGTHTVSKGSKTTLWQRLRSHRGGRDLSGNHRGSIFRLHVGAAMLQNSFDGDKPETWGKGQTSTADIRRTEMQLETRVSEYIGEMSLLWLDIADEASASSDRSYIERNSIGLLAGPSGPLDLSSPSWLGRHSAREAIRGSGLWNVNYVSDAYDPRFLAVFGAYVKVTLGQKRPPRHSLAPPGWSSLLNDRNREQLPLFQEGFAR